MVIYWCDKLCSFTAAKQQGKLMYAIIVYKSDSRNWYPSELIGPFDNADLAGQHLELQDWTYNERSGMWLKANEQAKVAPMRPPK